MVNPIDRLLVNIALLSLVDDLPEPPSVNISSQYIEAQEPQPHRTLSFNYEIIITQQLAFVCAYSGDRLHVLATCVEEATPKSCLVIRFAANSGKHEVLCRWVEVDCMYPAE